MRSRFFRIEFVTLLTFTVLVSSSVLAQTPATAPPAKAATTAEKKARPIPFHGKIAAIDASARTITVGSRVFNITSETKLLNRDKTPATMAAGKPGLEISGSYRKAPDGKLLANSIYFGPKPETEKTPVKAPDKS